MIKIAKIQRVNYSKIAIVISCELMINYFRMTSYIYSLFVIRITHEVCHILRNGIEEVNSFTLKFS